MPRRRPETGDSPELARTRERFLTAERIEPERVRDAILASWWRSRQFNVAADRIHLDYQREPDLDTPIGGSTANSQNVYFRQGQWHLLLTLTKDHVRGSGFHIPRGIGNHYGLNFGDGIDLTSPLTEMHTLLYNLQTILQNHIARTTLLPLLGVPYLDTETPLGVWRSGFVAGHEPSNCVQPCLPSPGMALEHAILGGLHRIMEWGWEVPSYKAFTDKYLKLAVRNADKIHPQLTSFVKARHCNYPLYITVLRKSGSKSRKWKRSKIAKST